MAYELFNRIFSGSNGQPKDTEVTDEDLKSINGLKQNGPLRPLSKDQVHVRAIYILGEDATAKQSVHPESKLNGKDVKVLSKLATLSVGAPMMEGHRFDKVPWGRIFRANVLDKVQGYKTKVLKIWYYFLKNQRGTEIQTEIDGGIRSEGSISYGFGKARCSICHKEMKLMSFFGMTMTSPTCGHKIGEKVDGQEVSWYPDAIKFVGEISHVFRGAYPNTKGALNAAYSGDELVASERLDEILEGGKGYDNSKLILSLDKIEVADWSQAGIKVDEIETVKKLIKATGDFKAGIRSYLGQWVDFRYKVCLHCGKHMETAKIAVEGNIVLCGCEGRFFGLDSPPIWEGREDETEEDKKKREDEEEEERKRKEKEKEDMAAHPDETEEERKKREEEEEKKRKEKMAAHPDETEEERKKREKEEEEEKKRKEEMARHPEDRGGHTHTTDNPKGEHKSHKESESRDGGHDKEGDGSHAHDFMKGSKSDGDHKHDKDNPQGDHAHRSHLAKQSGHEEDEEEEKKKKENEMVKKKEEEDEDEKRDKKEEKKDDEGLAVGENQPDIDQKTIALGKPIGPVKPRKSGFVNNEFFELEDFKGLDGEFLIEPKYDGIWMEIHRKGDKIWIFSDEGNEHTEKFPSIAADAQAERGNNFIIAGEMVKMRGRQRLGHEDVAAYIFAKRKLWEDNAFRFKIFDIMMAKGEDVRSLSLIERRGKLDSAISNTDQLHKTKFKRVKDGDEIVEAIPEMRTREGAMIKGIDSTYSKEGEKDTFKWKSQTNVDGKVTKREMKEGGGFVYTVEVGRGKEAQQIGKTFATSVKANVGQIIEVSVDKVTETNGKFTWFAPKVITLRLDKTEPDPISTLKKIAVKKGEGEPEKKEMDNVITLGEIIPRLKKMDRDWSIWLVGGIVERGYTSNDLDIVTNFEPTQEHREQVAEALGSELAKRIDWTYDVMGPVGPSLEVLGDMSVEALQKWKFGNKFVLQKHWWGKKAHWDMRFGAPRTPRMWGWTCFSEPTTMEGGKKAMCVEKRYHDPIWMTLGDRKPATFEPGEPGNPTKNLTAFMSVIDRGDYTFIRRKPKFMEVSLSGKKYKGRYVWREITVPGGKAPDERKVPQAYKDEKGEGRAKDKKIWIMWKPKDQVVGGKLMKLEIRYDRKKDMWVYWEVNEIDYELMDYMGEAIHA